MSEAEAAKTADSTEADSAPDPLENVKAEFNRKYGNVEAEVNSLKQTNAALQAQLAALATPANKPGKEDIDPDTILTNTSEFVQKLENKIATRMANQMAQRDQEQNERNQTIQSLVAEYPELATAGSDLHTETLKVLEALPSAMKGSPVGYQTAVYKAAANLALPPKAKRKEAEDKGGDFTFRGGKKEAPKKSPKSDIPDGVLKAAELMGINLDDEKELSALKKATQRNFSRFE